MNRLQKLNNEIRHTRLVYAVMIGVIVVVAVMEMAKPL